MNRMSIKGSIKKRLLAALLGAALSLGMAAGMPGTVSQAFNSNEKALDTSDKFVDGEIKEKRGAFFYYIDTTAAGWLTLTYQGRSIGRASYQLYDNDKSTSYFNKTVSGSTAASPKTDTTTCALNKGQYILKVYSTGNETGKFKVKASFKSAKSKEHEPNNVSEDALPLGYKEKIMGFLAEDDKTDYYKIKVPRIWM